MKLKLYETIYFCLNKYSAFPIYICIYSNKKRNGAKIILLRGLDLTCDTGWRILFDASARKEYIYTIVF